MANLECRNKHYGPTYLDKSGKVLNKVKRNEGRMKQMSQLEHLLSWLQHVAWNTINKYEENRPAEPLRQRAQPMNRKTGITAKFTTCKIVFHLCRKTINIIHNIIKVVFNSSNIQSTWPKRLWIVYIILSLWTDILNDTDQYQLSRRVEKDRESKSPIIFIKFW